MENIILGTRGSELALTQTEMVTAALRAAHDGLRVERRIIQTAGDKRQDLRFADFHSGAVPDADKGIFIKELELALDDGRVHSAVHSLKDMPSALEERYHLAAILPRAPVQDVLVTASPGGTLAGLRPGARVGTSSARRARQLAWLRPDIEVVEIRGNVPTRARKVLGENALDAVMLAAAGLIRLGLMSPGGGEIRMEDVVLGAEELDADYFLPAAGQGAVAVECLAANHSARDLFAPLDDAATRACVVAEREFLRLLGAGCQTPVGARSGVTGGALRLRVRVFDEADLAAPPVELEAEGSAEDPAALAAELAARFKESAPA